MLAAVESLTLGAAGVAHRERGSEAFEMMIRQSFEHSPPEARGSRETVRAIASGSAASSTGGCGRARSRSCRAWSRCSSTGRSPTSGPRARRSRAAAAAAEPQPEAAAGTGTELDWHEPPDSPRSRAELSQRERIVRAVGQLVVEKGYETLSIPAISARAGTSNQTFYEHFSNKREAFLAAFDVTAAEGLIGHAKAFEAAGDRPGRGRRGDPGDARAHRRQRALRPLTFFDLQTAGPVALDRADAVMDSFTAFLRPGVAPKGISDRCRGRHAGRRQRRLVGDPARAGRRTRRGRCRSWRPELVRIVLTPFAARPRDSHIVSNFD